MSFRRFIKEWVHPEVFPLVAAVAFACSAATFFGYRSILHSEVVFDPSKRNDFLTSKRHNKLFSKEQCIEFQAKIQNEGVLGPDVEPRK